MAFAPMRGLRAALLAGEPKFGIFGLGSDPDMLEIAGLRGLDFAVVDTEHSTGTNVARVIDLIRAADSVRLPVIVRLAKNDPVGILNVLDSGAIGVMIPHIRTQQDAEQAVSASKYPPAGTRGMCPVIRANGYAGIDDWPAYVRVANEETIVIALVEDRIGVDNLDAIAAVEGIDVIWVGLGDLAQDLGGAELLPRGHPSLITARTLGLSTARQHGKIAYCTLPPDGSDSLIGERLAEGFRMFTWPDLGIVDRALAQLHAKALAATQMLRAPD